jgi:predicted nucleic acid-binding Zn ribbon protein
MEGADDIMGLCRILRQLESEWRSIVKGSLGERSAPVSYSDDVLTVSVRGPAAVQDMNFRKNAIMSEIRSRVRPAVRDIKTHSAGVHRQAGGHTPAASQAGRPKKLPAADEKKVEAICADVLARHGDMDPNLALILARCRAVSES